MEVIYTLNKMTAKKEKTYTKEQVTELLKKQIIDCADAFQGNNMSEYCAKKKIRETKLVFFEKLKL
jgi:hypothetical protein